MNKLFLISFILGIFLLSSISAEVVTTVNAFYSEIQEDGSMIYTDVPVENFQTIGYVCLNSDCSLVGDKIDGLSKTSTGNSVNLIFPTELQNSNGYGIWFYKNGYIHWEQKADFYGNRIVDEPLNIYLIKKQFAWAPIMDMHVVNEVHPDIPVEVGVEVGIDADTYSALENAGPLDYNPVELDAGVETVVNLEIRTLSDTLIYREERVLNILYSEFEEVVFEYSGFSETGAYNVELTTEVTDDKIINSVSQFARTEIRVIPFGLTDYSFSLVSGLSMDPVSPEKDENVDFGFNYNSAYIDEFGIRINSDTNVSIIVYKDGVQISEENSSQDSSEDYFSFSKTFSDLGDYSIIVVGTPSECFGLNGCLSSLQEITFVIKEIAPLDITAPTITISSPIDGEIYNISDILLNINTDENAEVWFNLNCGADVSLGSGTDFEYNLTDLSERVHILNVYARDSSNNQRIVSISFTVDLDGEGDESHDGKSSGSRNVDSSDITPISNSVVAKEYDETPVQINLKINSEKIGSSNIFFWILLICVLILVLISAMLIAKRIN